MVDRILIFGIERRMVKTMTTSSSLLVHVPTSRFIFPHLPGSSCCSFLISDIPFDPSLVNASHLVIVRS